MTVPVFEEYEPAGECGCPGCADRRRSAALPLRAGGHPAAHGARRALVLATAAGVVLGAQTAAAALARPPVPGMGHGRPASEGDGTDLDTGPATEQGVAGALHGSAAARPEAPSPHRLQPITRADIINRAKKWVAAQVPYSMEKYWTDGYRQDCSGFVSMAWNLGTNEWTGSLGKFAVRIAKEELEPGDILLFHNPDNPTKGSHVVIFGGWTDYTHTSYVAYEQTPPRARRQPTPYAYSTNSARYVPYRYKGLGTGNSGAIVTEQPPAEQPAEPPVTEKPVTEQPAPAQPVPASLVTAFPGAAAFGPGARNAYVTRLGQMLVARGGKRFYTQGPGPVWGEADRRATEAFQRAQGWTGSGADGLPGARTWSLLVRGEGKDIPPASGTTGAPTAAEPPQTEPPVQAPATPAGAAGAPAAPPASPTGAAWASWVRVPAFPGRAYFRPGRSSAYVTELGRQLLRKGFGRYYTSGPGPLWSEADRRNVEAFQRAQGWRGAAADGYPGPETWRRLFA